MLQCYRIVCRRDVVYYYDNVFSCEDLLIGIEYEL